MIRGSGILWDLRKTNPYEVYKKIPFQIPQALSGDCFDRYLVRLEEMRSSIQIILFCINRIPPGSIKTSSGTGVFPPRLLSKKSMEATIQHFKAATQGITTPTGDIYSAVEAPKGEFGIFLASTGGKSTPYRVKIRAPGFYHLQGLKCLSHQHLLSDVLTIIGTADIVFGEVDR